MNMGRVARRGFAVVWLAFVWITLWGRWSLANAIVGLVIGTLTVTLLALPDVRFRAQPSLKGLVVWFGTVFCELIVASIQVAAQALRRDVELQSSIISVQLQSKSELVHALVIESLTLVPGSMVLEFRRSDRTLYTHVLGISSPDAIEKARQHTLKMERLVVAAIGDRRGEM